MEPVEAEKEKVFVAEKHLATVRAIVIVFGTLTFFLLDPDHIRYGLAYALMMVTWTYGAFVIIYRPYKKHPVFLAGWFTWLSDCVLINLWIYATGGYYSPYHVIFYTSVIAVAFRFGLRTTLYTALLYTATYYALLWWMRQLEGNEAMVLVRTGFIFISGFLTNLITTETLDATRQKLVMKELMEEAQVNHHKLAENQQALNDLYNELRLKNDIFNHAEENAKLGSYSWDLETDEVIYSDNMFRVMGHEPGDFRPGYEKYLTFVHPDDVPIAVKMKDDLFANDKTITTSVLRLISKPGEIKHVHATAKFSDERAVKVIGTLQDISNDVKMRQELQEKNLKLEQSNLELASFNYIASHDLQEPVRKILTFAELVLQREQKALNEVSAGHLERIVRAAKRMQHLIVAFLNYSKIENTALTFELTNLNQVIDEVRNLLQEQLEEKKAVIERTGLPQIMSVQFQVQQLFVNLVSNALKYSRPGVPPLIKISAEKTKGSATGIQELVAEQTYWQITVCDNGIGFEPRYSEKIFEVFQRLHSQDEYEGTGIGLAICKKIVQSHKGSIMARGEQMQGACFMIYFPAYKELKNS